MTIGVELTSFKHAEEKPHHSDGGIAVRSAQAHGDGPPREHEKGNPPTGPHPLEEIVRRHLKHGIRNKEDHQGDGVLVVGHASHSEQIVTRRSVEDLGVADVGAVQVAEKVDARSQRDDAPILLAEEFGLKRRVDNGRGIGELA